MEGYGNCTVVDHGNGLATLYGHQSQLLVTSGQQVHRGDLIGLVGHTGFATGPHLHFEVRVDGVPVDPIPFL
jgi:murein DD-endopeptidase MepM/ murein hydrolase activator NlpD